VPSSIQRRPERHALEARTTQYTPDVPNDLVALFQDGSAPLFLVDSFGAPLFASRAARALLGSGDLTLMPIWADVQAVAAQAIRLRAVNDRCCARSGDLLVGLDVVRLVGRAITLSAGPSSSASVVVAERLEGLARRAAVDRARALLTDRERAVAELLAQGCSPAEVASRLGIAPHAVRRRSERALGKVGARTAAGLAALFPEDLGSRR
jgi:DNA-binding CsgD family transcriptional regulator